MPEVADQFRRDDDDTRRVKDMNLLRAHVNQLAEHFDAVEIIVTRDTGPKNGSEFACMGVGNWYARYGMVQAWLKNENKHL